jgi:hypothetical protein
MVPPGGESDLDHLLRNMQPVLEDEELVFCSLPPDQAERYFPICQGYYNEREGVTVIISRHLADLEELTYDYVFKRITLDVFSNLGAVGFIARITEVLAAQGISLNVISAFYHDHIYVQAAQAQLAIDTLILWQDKLSE